VVAIADEVALKRVREHVRMHKVEPALVHPGEKKLPGGEALAHDGWNASEV
jgi:hypothetical protein